MYEKKYSIKKILIDLIKKWYFICLAGLMGALLLGYVGYLKSDKPGTGAVTLTEEQIDEVTNLQALKLQELQLIQFRDTSVIMRMNSGNVHKLTTQYYVKCDTLSGVRVEDIVMAYQSFVKDGILYEDIARQVGDDFSIEDLKYTIRVNYEMQAAIFTVNIIWDKPEELLELNTIVQDALMKKQAYYADIIGEHELIALGKVQSIGIDQELMEFQEDIHGDIKSTQAAISSMEAKMTSAQILLAEGEDIDVVSGIVNKSKVIDVKSVIFGFLIGCIVAMVLYVVRYMMMDYVTATEEVKGVLNGKCAGCIKSGESNMIENRILLNRIVMKCKRDNESQVMLLLRNENAIEDDLKEQIKTVLREEEIEVIFGYDIMNNLTMQKELVSSKEVFLFVALKKDKFKDIIEILDFCDSQKIVISEGFALD